MQILKKRELSRKSELKEYWGQVLWSEPPIMAGVFCGRRQGCWNETTGENGKLRVCSECEEAEGSGRHRAGSSWGIQQKQPASGAGCDPPWVSCPQVKKAPPPGRASPRCSPHLYRSVPLPAAACRAWPSGKVYSLHSVQAILGTLL